MKVIERDGRTFIERRLSTDRADLLEVCRKPAPRGDKYLNLAAIAFDFSLNIDVVFRNQREGWPFNGHEPLPFRLFDVEAPFGNTIRQPFILGSDVEKALPKRSDDPDDSRDLFKCDGVLVAARWSLYRRFHVPAGRQARELFEKLGLEFKRVPSPKSGHWIEVTPEEDVLKALELHNAERSRPPKLKGRPAIWLKDFAKRVYRARHGSDPPVRWDYNSVAQHICKTWIKKGCRHLGGRCLRAAQEDVDPQRMYVDEADAMEILAAIEADRVGKTRDGGLHAAEIVRKFGVTYGVTLKKLYRWEADGLIQTTTTTNATHGGIKDGRPQKLYQPDQIEAVAGKEWRAPQGHEPERQLAERFCALENRPYLRKLLFNGLLAGRITRVKDPRKRNGFHYKISEAAAEIDAAERDDDRWLRMHEQGDSFGKIAMLERTSDHHFPAGKKGKSYVAIGVARAKKRRKKALLTPRRRIVNPT